MWGNGSLYQVMAGGFLLHLVMGTVYTYVLRRLLDWLVDCLTG